MTTSSTQCAPAPRRFYLHGLLAHWPEVAAQTWVAPLLDWEEQQRACRSLERRLQTAHIGRFKPLCDFDWNWPKRCDRAAIEALMALDFLAEATNVVLVGPNGVGKSTPAQNIAHQALIHGHTVLFHQRRPAASAISPRSTAILPCADACATMLARSCWSSTRLATCPTPTAMPTCCSNSSAGVTNTRARWSPPTAPSQSGAKYSPTPPASSPWSTASSTTPRSSPSKANRIGSRRKPANAPTSALVSAVEPGHEQVAADTAIGASPSPSDHH